MRESAADPAPGLAGEATLFERVWAVVRTIPPGRVTTYGLVAQHLGTRSARGVGWALRQVAGAGPLDIPCHRVVNREGALTGRRHFASPTVMEERLHAEGVAFLPDGRVDLGAHLWDPARPDA